jgi:hypothetical protein
VQGLVAKFSKMKTTILLFAVIFGYTTPTYSQLNHHRETGVWSDQFQNKKYGDFGTYKFEKFDNYKFDKFSNFSVDKFNDFLSSRERNRPAPGNSQINYIRRNNMPCLHPKSGEKLPCFKPTGTFPMRVFKHKDVIWGILW